MRSDQGGLCLICLRAPAVHVDHDHGTGEIRGMLCFNCNGGLGQFKDDVEVTARAVQYLLGELVRPYRFDAGVYAMDVAPPLGETSVTGPGRSSGEPDDSG